MNKFVLQGALRTVRKDLAIARETDCPGCRELAIARASVLVNSLLNIAAQNQEPQPLLIPRGDRFVARYTFAPLDGQEGA